MLSRFKIEEIDLAIKEYKAHVKEGINKAFLSSDKT
jgi:hypothetical protein